MDQKKSGLAGLESRVPNGGYYNEKGLVPVGFQVT
jgi:hypothetical protein